MENQKRITADNIVLLNQGRELIQNIGTKTYRKAFPGLKKGTIGAHFRHCLEVYQCFISGVEEHHVDYENRPRAKGLESEPEMAIEAIDRIVGDLEGLCSSSWDPFLKLTYRYSDHSREANLDTTVARELVYLISHTIHHYALIRVILLHHGIAVDEQFGVAPSTLKHWEETGRRSNHALQVNPK